MSMTREQRKYWRKSAIQAVVGVVFCIGLVYGVSYLVNVVM